MEKEHAQQENEYQQFAPEDILNFYCNCKALSWMIKAVFLIRTKGYQISQKEFLFLILHLQPSETELRTELPEQVVDFYHWLQEEEKLIGKELERRCKDKEVGAALIASQLGIPHAVQQMERLMQVDRIQGFNPLREEDSNDIKNSAWERALRLYVLFSKNYGAKYQVEFLSMLSMSDKERKICGRIAQIAGTIQEDMHRRFGPVLAGEVEVIPAKVRDYRREKWRTIKRRKMILRGSEDFPDKGPESWRAEWDFSKTAAEGRQKEIDPEVNARISSPEEYRLRLDDENQELKLDLYAYEIAMKRAGKKGLVYLDGLKAGKTSMDAAREAGISRRTGERIKEAIRQTPPSKTPEKARR